MSSELVIGIVLTALAYGGLIATVVHARTVIRRLSEEEFEGGVLGYDERPVEESDADD